MGEKERIREAIASLERLGTLVDSLEETAKSEIKRTNPFTVVEADEVFREYWEEKTAAFSGIVENVFLDGIYTRARSLFRLEVTSRQDYLPQLLNLLERPEIEDSDDFKKNYPVTVSGQSHNLPCRSVLEHEVESYVAANPQSRLDVINRGIKIAEHENPDVQSSGYKIVSRAIPPFEKSIKLDLDSRHLDFFLDGTRKSHDRTKRACLSQLGTCIYLDRQNEILDAMINCAREIGQGEGKYPHLAIRLLTIAYYDVEKPKQEEIMTMMKELDKNYPSAVPKELLEFLEQDDQDDS